MKYEECLNIFEEFANKLCCLPHTMSQHLFDIKRLTSIPVRKRTIGNLLIIEEEFRFCCS